MRTEHNAAAECGGSRQCVRCDVNVDADGRRTLDDRVRRPPRRQRSRARPMPGPRRTRRGQGSTAQMQDSTAQMHGSTARMNE